MRLGICLIMAGGMAFAMLSACHHSEKNISSIDIPEVFTVEKNEAHLEHFGEMSDVRIPDVKIHVKRGQALAMQTDGMMLTAMDAAVLHESDYSATSLASDELPPLPQGMVNMTAATAGYRLLPSGEHFMPYAELRMTYDPKRLPEGYTPNDIYTSFYDTAALAWVRLERVEVDTVNHEIVSLTTHFTDFINELLKAPEMPETQAFVPTAMNDLEAVSPMDGLTAIQPPTANNNGTANVSYPIAIPAGRSGMQPNLALSYSSGGGSGWLGVGWDIPVPSITLDTRWGVPRYNASKETEIYLLDGEQLITKEADGTPRAMPHRTNQQTNRLPDGTQFYARTGDAHDSIVRHGNGPQNYWWEVVDRNGTTHYYGHYADISRNALPCILCDDNGNIARWPLCESRDLYGNCVRYYYDLVTVRNHGAEGRQLYLDSISYTGLGEHDGFYTVVFCRTVNPTVDILVSCNNGFKEITDQVLNNVFVKYGDSILTVWLFDMENAYKTNYKNRLVSVTKVDSAAYGMRSFLMDRCQCTHSSDSLSGEGQHSASNYLSSWTTAVPYDKGYAGSTTLFNYYDAPDPENMFGSEVVSENLPTANLHGSLRSDPNMSLTMGKATGLGLSHSSSWNIGGSASGGFGLDVSLTSQSAGGNYTRSQSASESLLSLVDLDGDGLADKVYVKDGQMYFCRHIHNSDSTIGFESPVEVSGASHFLKESSYSNTFGSQFAIGFSGSASWTNSKSTTSIYFADVNGDGLVDLVDNGQVLFNSLNGNGFPEFTLYEASNHQAEDNETEATPVVTSASDCGGIIFDGEVNDSITCERIWVCDTSFTCDTLTALSFYNHYLQNPDTLVGIESVGKEANWVEVKRYHREWDCSYHDDSPSTEAVRVWIAPRDGQIQLTSEVGLKEDTSATRRASKHADGVVYTLQHTHNVNLNANPLTAASNTILRTFDICDTCYYDVANPDYLYTFDSTLNVTKGDMLFFRLRSKVSRQFDNMYDWHQIQYNDETRESYDSKEDFVLSADYCFQAPVDGYYIVEGDYTDNDGSFELEINAEGNVSTYSGHGTQTLNEEDSIHKGGTICFTVRSSGASSQWGKVECRPYLTFVPDSTKYRYDTNAFTNPHTIDTIRLTDTVKGYVPCRYNIVYQGNDTIYDHTLLRKMFGPLYNGWGQFAYHSLDTGALGNYIDVSKLVPPDMLVPGSSNPSDTNGFRAQLRSCDSLDLNSLSRDSSFSSFQEHHASLYSPLSYSSYWVGMTPDVEHQVWVSFGRQNHVGRDNGSNSLQERWHSSSASIATTSDMGLPETTTYDDPIPAASTNGTPAKAVRKVNRSKSQSWSLGAAGMGESGSFGHNTIVTDYMDLNGDRYPDNVGVDRVQYSQQWGGIGTMCDLPDFLLANNGSSTSSSGLSYSASAVSQERIISGSQDYALFTLKTEGACISGSGSIGHDRASGSWIDINGDGLADFVTEWGLVFLNVGYGFVNDHDWNFDTIRSGISGSVNVSATANFGQTVTDDFFNVWQGSIQGGAGISSSYNQTTAMMMDINGDGLPDKIWRDLNDLDDIISEGALIGTYVSLNLGIGRWSPPMLLDIGRFHASINYSESLNVGLTFGYTMLGVFKLTVGIDGSPYSGSVNRDHIQLVDVDADGLPDLVSSDNESQLSVRYNQGGRTNLMRSVTNCNNAYFLIEYTLSDADYNQPSRSWLMTKVTTCDSLNINNGATTTVTEFSYFNPRYDRYERTSYGYGTVVTANIDPDSAVVYRTVERNYYNRNMLRRGKLKREITRDGNGNPYIEKLHRCTYADYTNGDTLNADSECPEICYPAVETTITHFYEGNNTPLLTTGERVEFDRYHNVLKYSDLGDIGDTTDGLLVLFDYFSGIPNNLVGLRKGYTVMPAGSATAIRSAKFGYDFAHGKMVRQVLHNVADSSVYDFCFDSAYGNLLMAKHPVNANGERMGYRYTYDSIVHTYPVEIRNAHNETMNTTYDIRFGKPLTITDPTGNTMTYRYDFAGRVIAVNSPLNTGQNATLEIEYHPLGYYRNGLTPSNQSVMPSPTGHSYSVSTHYDDSGNVVTKTVVITNGFGNPIQTKKGLRVGETDMMQVSGKSVVDAFGRTIQQYDPVVESVSVHNGAYNSEFDSSSAIISSFDVLDRTTSTIMPLGITTSYVYSVANNMDGRRCFVTTTTDPNGNVATQYSDYEGRQVQLTDANGGITLMQYDNIGQLVSTTDPEGFSTSYRYDMLGRMTQRVHPDAGVSAFVYDNAGNLLRETNPLGQINYTYSYYRVLKKRYSYMTANDVTYTYGTSGTGTGRPVCVTDGSGMYQCQYNDLGNVVAETRTIALPGLSKVLNFSMRYTYDSWGRMLSMTYPDGEVVSYTYQWGGDLFSVNGAKGASDRKYVSSINYNTFGQRDSVRYANGTSVRYHYDPLHRMVRLSSRQQDGSFIQDIYYTFDNNSNITRISNQAPSVGSIGGTYDNSYVYDPANRLTNAGGTSFVGQFSFLSDISKSGRMRKKTINSPSLSLSDSAALYYGYTNASQPHAVRRVYDRKSQQLHDLRWDEAGNLGQISHADSDGLFESGRFLFWTADNRLHTVSDNKYHSYYIYDHAGERRVKLTGHSQLLDVNAEKISSHSILDNVTLYPSAYLVMTNQGYTKHYYMGSERIAARIGGGGLEAIDALVSVQSHLSSNADSLLSQSISQANSRVLEQNHSEQIREGLCPNKALATDFSEIPDRIDADVNVNVNSIHSIVSSLGSVLHDESEVYYYHSDHLGSASWITDRSGLAIQHLQYLPYGEPYLNQRISGYDERFTFTGKEQDEETGYGYFGARYMDHELTATWLSVDPMADKYPSISPYAYCAWNPVRLVDLDGEEIWIVGVDGNKYQYKKGKLYSVDGTLYKGADIYATKVAQDLDKGLCGVKKEIREIVNSDKVITITNDESYSVNGGNCICMLDEESATNGTGSGSIIYYNRDIESTRDSKRPNFIGLAHELGHAYDGMMGIIDDTMVDSDIYVGSVPKSEINAVRFENKARAYWNIEPRTSYYNLTIKNTLGIN